MQKDRLPKEKQRWVIDDVTNILTGKSYQLKVLHAESDDGCPILLRLVLKVLGEVLKG
jgi:hypothetical protein